MAYPDTLLRGLITPGSVTQERYVTAEAFLFQDFRKNRSDNYNELSINWEDSDEAVDVLLKQKKEGSEDPQFKIGFARMSLSRIKDVLKPHISDKTYSFERKPVDGNPYHGNLLSDAKLPKQIVKNIQHSLATIATADVYLRSDDKIKYLKKENKTMPKVSVCIPIYNVEQYIGRCIESVISQSLKEIEIIIVNDCTPDNSMEIVRQYAAADNRIKIIEHDINHGLMMARRTGYMAASGDYITFCDSDDTLADGALEALYVTAEREQADIVSGTIQYVPNKGERNNWNNELKYGTDRVSVFKSLLKGEIGHNLCSKLFKKELLQNNDYRTFDIFINAEDAALFYQAVDNLKKMIAIKDVTYLYWQNKESSSQIKLSSARLENVVVANNIIYNICSKYADLKDYAWNTVSISLYGLYIKGYNNDYILDNLLLKHSMQDLVMPSKMIKHLPISISVKLFIKRIIFRLLSDYS